MNALTLALALAMGPTDPEDTRLPLSLAEAYAEPAAAKDEFSMSVGGHLGIAGAYDGNDPSFVIGGNFRVHILEWLGAEATIDFQTNEGVEHTSAHISQIPFEFAALFYPPIDLGQIRPYGIFGFGWTITSISGAGVKDDTSANLLFFLGFGAEFELSPQVALDANVRFVFAQDPPHSGNFSADWAQFTVGILFKLAK
jgi:opacity protein-like surface antigen